jgi:hypothetical protein
MREAAESAETDEFDPQIDAATGTLADELQVGKIKNKVLKLTGEVQGINIQASYFYGFFTHIAYALSIVPSVLFPLFIIRLPKLRRQESQLQILNLVWLLRRKLILD